LNFNANQKQFLINSKYNLENWNQIEIKKFIEKVSKVFQSEQLTADTTFLFANHLTKNEARFNSCVILAKMN